MLHESTSHKCQTLGISWGCEPTPHHNGTVKVLVSPSRSLLGGSSQDGRKWLITHGDRVRPLRIGLWDHPFQMVELHGL